jgi:hypothetical protein
VHAGQGATTQGAGLSGPLSSLSSSLSPGTSSTWESVLLSPVWSVLQPAGEQQAEREQEGVAGCG